MPTWVAKPLPDITSREEEVRLPGGAAERIYIPPPPPWIIGRALFLRGMGAVYVAAFTSLAVQAQGLFGPRGVAAFDAFIRLLAEHQQSHAAWPSLFRAVPTLAERPEVVAWIGAAFGAAMMIGVLPPLAALAPWVLYLSFVTIGAPFLSFQWDALLLESGFLAILVSPWTFTLKRGRKKPAPEALRWCLWFLVVRLMLLSSLVKLFSGSPPWRDGTALEFHWWTQPLPNPLSWWMAQSPLWLDRTLTFASLGAEAAPALLVFFGRWGRFAAALLIVLIQIGITLTGNYGFFNLLTAVLALSLVDDSILRRLLRRPLNVPIPLVVSKAATIARGAAIVVAVSIALLVAAPVSAAWLLRVSGSARGPFDGWLPGWTATLLSVPYEWGVRWRLASGYGLFADMTTTRPEITIEATRDGVRWEPFLFRFKPGPLDRRPPVVPLHMPRLDWQLWFAGLAWPHVDAWQISLHQALLEARPEVLALFEHAPFDGHPPRAVRWRRDLYEFSTLDGDAARRGEWWIAVERGRPVSGFSVR